MRIIRRTFSSKLAFDDGKLAFSSLTSYEILRALVVFKACSFSPLVRNAPFLLNTSNRFFGRSFTESIVKHSFFAHFCAGTSAKDIEPVIQRLNRNGIHSILDYAAEADLKPTPGIVGRSYDSSIEEDECDANLQVFLKCIDAASRFEDGFAAVKVSGLGRPSLLAALARVVSATRKTFLDLDSARTRELTFQQFYKGLSLMGVNISAEQAKELFSQFDAGGDGKIDLFEWTEYLRVTDSKVKAFFLTPEGKEPLPTLSAAELVKFENLVKRLDKLASYASERNVRLMVDAEQTYFQSGIDHLVINLQRKYNNDKAVVFNTYQAYLRDSYARLLTDLERSRREEFIFAAKLVRGAYMVAERKRAEQRNEKDPIQPSIESTHLNYNRCIDVMLQNIDRCEVMVASHNEQSIIHTIDRMEQLGILKKSQKIGVGNIYFGQLLGMADHISLTLGAHGYRAFKYVPFGPVGEVMPYLIRRAEENAGILHGEGVVKERRMLWNELKRRMLGV